MDSSIALQLILTYLSPYFVKVGEATAETIGEKIGDSLVSNSVWKQIKSVFILPEDRGKIQSIENHPTASTSDLTFIEQRLASELDNNVNFKKEILAALNISGLNKALATECIKGIRRLQKDIVELQIEMERTDRFEAGKYQNEINSQTRKMKWYYERLDSIFLGNE